MPLVGKMARGKITGDHEKRQEFMGSLADVSIRGTSGRESGPHTFRAVCWTHFFV
jgi:hypothetical protein